MSLNTVMLIVIIIAMAIVIFILIMKNIVRDYKNTQIKDQLRETHGQFLQDDEMNEIEIVGLSYGLPLFEYQQEDNIQGLTEKKPVDIYKYENYLRKRWGISEHDSAINRLGLLADLQNSNWQRDRILVDELEARAGKDDFARKTLERLNDATQMYKSEMSSYNFERVSNNQLMVTCLAAGIIDVEISDKYLIENTGYARSLEKALQVIEPSEVKEVYSTYAWDICRLSAFAKWSFWLGYISRKEMDRCFDACRELVQKNGDSWEEYGVSFLLGLTLDGLNINDYADSTRYVIHEVLEKQNVQFK
ncbi:DUF1266 domain-containing protein [Lactobacillus sp. YT155]|uniref:DUF1266 domain-containing protein n=1 Tax=Lactobacillus sp. YT155 TaxID=3060955 RepID=UPI00265FD6FE|nr:DUF1266 domain-containing protein [Lactobacillus sp. YT155]MDO1604577.1 DUF1266 domain-containing protein [Lactobacillus sp. YT155]